MADDIKLLSSIVKELQESNQKAGVAADAAKENVAEIKALVSTNKIAIKQAMQAGNVDLQKSLQDQQSKLSESLEAALAKEKETSESLSVSDATDTAFISQIQETFGGLQQASAEIYQKQADVTSQLKQNYDEVVRSRYKLQRIDEQIAKAQEKKDVKAYNRLVKEKEAIGQTIKDLNESSKSLGTTLKDNNQMLSALGMDEVDESIVAEDPNKVPPWAVAQLNELKLSNLLTKEGFGALGDKLSNLSFGDLPGVGAAKSVFDVFADLAKKTFMLIGGFTAFQGFLDGMGKTAEWFNGETGPLETIASGITGILLAFGAIDPEDAEDTAKSINAAFVWIKEKFVWMFEGVKKSIGSISNIMEGEGNIFSNIKGLLNGGAIAAFALIKPDWAFAATKGILKLSKGALGLIGKGVRKMLAKQASMVAEEGAEALADNPKLVKKIGTKLTGMLSTAGASAKSMASNMASGLSSLGSKIASTASSFAKGAVSTVARMGASMASGLASLGTAIAGAASSFMAAAVPLLVAAAPFIAAAAAIALAIKGIYEGFQEGMAIFEETGSVVEGLKAGISKMFGTIIGFIPDLLKDIVSWAARKLGFEDFADDLDSFSFTDMITDAFRSVYNWFELLPLKLGKAILGFLKGVPGLGRFIKDDHIAAIDAKIAEKEQKFEKTKAAVEKRRAEKAEEERLEKQKEAEAEALEQQALEQQAPELDTAPEKPIEQQAPELDTASEKPIEQQAPEFEPAQAQQIIQNANIEFDVRPINARLESILKAMAHMYNLMDAEMASANKGSTIVNAPNTSQTINRSTTAVSTGLGHRNIGATRGMFGAPTSPLSSPN